MISSAVLDSLLLTLAALWVALGLAILIDRYRYERRMRYASKLEGRLRLAPTAAADAARSLTPQEFQQMVLSGLPPHVEAAVAASIAERLGDRQLRVIAEGSAPADLASRITALQVLVSARRPDAYYALDRCLRGERRVAAAAARMLIRLDDRRAAEILAAALCDRAFTPSRVAAAFDRMSVPRSDLLAAMVNHGDPTVRFWGMRLAGRLRAREWAGRARQLTNDPDALVRRAAVETLGTIGEQRDLVLLLTRFLDPAPMVRVHAARASAAFPSPAVADALCELLGDREWSVRAAARTALERVGDVATPALVRTLWEEDTFAANSAAEVLFASGAIGKTARELLIDPANPDAIRMVKRFVEIGGPQLERALLAQLPQPDATRLHALLPARVPGGSRR